MTRRTYPKAEKKIDKAAKRTRKIWAKSIEAASHLMSGEKQADI